MAQGAIKMKKSAGGGSSSSGGPALPKRGARVAAPKKARAVQDAMRVKKHSQSSNPQVERRLASMAGSAGAKLRILEKEARTGKKEREEEMARNAKKKLR